MKLDISKITDYLYVAASPQASDVPDLEARCIRLIISMIGGHPPLEVFSNNPFQLLWLETIDSIFIPMPVEKLEQGVEAALPIIQKGDGVMVYCVQGRHRSVAMATAILIAMGYTLPKAVSIIQKQRAIADPNAWHILWQLQRFEVKWHNQTASTDSWSERLIDIYSKSATEIISCWVYCLIKISDFHSLKRYLKLSRI